MNNIEGLYDLIGYINGELVTTSFQNKEEIKEVKSIEDLNKLSALEVYTVVEDNVQN